MCNIKDAERFEELAKIEEEEKDNDNSRKSYLEAASIYVLQAELTKNADLLKKANYCYKKSKEVMGEKWDQIMTKQELAKRTLDELNKQKSNVLSILNGEI